MGQELEMKDAGVVGINVTNPPAVGGAGLSVALDILAGGKHPRVIHLVPEVHDSSSPEGQTWLKDLYDPKVDPTLAAYSPVKPYTHYIVQQEKECKGPGE
jgi:ribose transport system substrate-binding protein